MRGSSCAHPLLVVVDTTDANPFLQIPFDARFTRNVMDRHEFRQIVTNSWSSDEKNVLKVRCIFRLMTFFSTPRGCTDLPDKELWGDFNRKLCSR